MAITDELRRVAAKTECANGRCEKLYRGDLETIADRIDAAHEEALVSSYFDGVFSDEELAENGFVRLPKDADGEYIHIGDKVTCGASVWEVTGFRLAGGGWGICCTIFFKDRGGSGTNVYPPSELHHYHASTVEDVLTEFGIDWEHEDNCEDRAALLAEYAKRLKLAGEGE